MGVPRRYGKDVTKWKRYGRSREIDIYLTRGELVCGCSEARGAVAVLPVIPEFMGEFALKGNLGKTLQQWQRSHVYRID